MTTTIPVVEEAFPPSPRRERLDEPDWTESGTNNGRIAEHYAHLRENYTRLRDEHTRLQDEYMRFREEHARLSADSATLREESAGLRGQRAVLRAAQSEPGFPIMSGRSAGEIIGQSPAYRA